MLFRTYHPRLQGQLASHFQIALLHGSRSHDCCGLICPAMTRLHHFVQVNLDPLMHRLRTSGMDEAYDYMTAYQLETRPEPEAPTSSVSTTSSNTPSRAENHPGSSTNTRTAATRPQPYTQSDSSLTAAASSSTSGQDSDDGPSVSPTDWDRILTTVFGRSERECAICLGNLRRKGGQGVAVLSCSHIFHTDCVTSFEAFEVSRGGKASCPVCRSFYKKQLFDVHE